MRLLATVDCSDQDHWKQCCKDVKALINDNWNADSTFVVWCKHRCVEATENRRIPVSFKGECDLYCGSCAVVQGVYKVYAQIPDEDFDDDCDEAEYEEKPYLLPWTQESEDDLDYLCEQAQEDARQQSDEQALLDQQENCQQHQAASHGDDGKHTKRDKEDNTGDTESRAGRKVKKQKFTSSGCSGANQALPSTTTVTSNHENEQHSNQQIAGERELVTEEVIKQAKFFSEQPFPDTHTKVYFVQTKKKRGYREVQAEAALCRFLQDYSITSKHQILIELPTQNGQCGVLDVITDNLLIEVKVACKFTDAIGQVIQYWHSVIPGAPPNCMKQRKQCIYLFDCHQANNKCIEKEAAKLVCGEFEIMVTCEHDKMALVEEECHQSAQK